MESIQLLQIHHTKKVRIHPAHTHVPPANPARLIRYPQFNG